ncbi:UNVERIFIED_CONTAM: hypothetical protein HDU68_004146 [Siphonaria sp. JEL0065]|nr:hypothetical protein HDU68_004146 [Siphonaria sp. JEL0065]
MTPAKRRGLVRRPPARPIPSIAAIQKQVDVESEGSESEEEALSSFDSEEEDEPSENGESSGAEIDDEKEFSDRKVVGEKVPEDEEEEQGDQEDDEEYVDEEDDQEMDEEDEDESDQDGNEDESHEESGAESLQEESDHKLTKSPASEASLVEPDTSPQDTPITPQQQNAAAAQNEKQHSSISLAETFTSSASLFDPNSAKLAPTITQPPVSVIIQMCDTSAVPPISVSPPTRESSSSSWLPNFMNLFDGKPKPKAKELDKFVRSESAESFVSAADDSSSIASAAEPDESPYLSRRQLKALHDRSRSHNPSTGGHSSSRPSSRAGNSTSTAAALKEKDETITSLQRQQDSLEKLVSELRHENSRLGAQIHEKEVSLVQIQNTHSTVKLALETKLSTAKSQINTHQITIKVLETRLEEGVQSLTSQTGKHEAEIQKLLQESQQKMTSLESQLNLSKAETKTEVAEKLNIQGELNRVKDLNLKLDQSLQEQKKQLEESHNLQISALESKISALSLELSESKAKEESDESDSAKKLAETNQRVSYYKTQIETLENEMRGFLDSAAVLEQVKLQHAQTTQQVQEMTAKFDQATTRIQQLENENQELNTELQESHSKVEALKKDIDESTAGLSQLRLEVQPIQIQMKELETTLKETQLELASKTLDLENEKSHASALEGQLFLEKTKIVQISEASKLEHPDLSEFVSKIETLETSVIALNTEKYSLEASVKDLGAEIEALKATNSEHQKTLLKAKIERRLRASRISELWNELQAAKQVGEDKALELSKLQSEHEETKKEIQELDAKLVDAQQKADVIGLAQEPSTEVKELQQKIDGLIETHHKEKQEFELASSQFQSIQLRLQHEISTLQTEIRATKTQFKESDESNTALIQSLRESLAKQTLEYEQKIKDLQSFSTTKHNNLLETGPDSGSFMNEVLSELMVRSVQDSKSDIGNVWVQEWYKTGATITGAPNQSTNMLLEISKSIDGDTPTSNNGAAQDEANLESIKSHIIDSFHHLKTRVAQLESVCKEFEVFAQDAIYAAKAMEVKYDSAKSETNMAKMEIKEREQMIIRLHHVLEDGASMIGKEKMKSAVDAVRAAARLKKDVEARERAEAAARAQKEKEFRETNEALEAAARAEKVARDALDIRQSQVGGERGFRTRLQSIATAVKHATGLDQQQSDNVDGQSGLKQRFQSIALRHAKGQGGESNDRMRSQSLATVVKNAVSSMRSETRESVGGARASPVSTADLGRRKSLSLAAVVDKLKAK